MARRRGIRGKSTQGDRPQWQPLLNAVGERVTGDFKWMYVGIAAADVFAEVFAELPWLAGVTEEQVGASWEAVERLVDTG